MRPVCPAALRAGGFHFHLGFTALVMHKVHPAHPWRKIVLIRNKQEQRAGGLRVLCSFSPHFPQHSHKHRSNRDAFT